MKRKNYDGTNFGYTAQEMEQLRENFTQGDTSVWDDIFLKTHEDFLKQVQSKGIPTEDAEDLVQNVWIKVYEQLWKGFRNYEKVRHWFGQVLHNKCMDYFNTTEQQTPPQEVDTAKEDAERAEAAQIYMQVLNQMKPECIEVIRLHLFDGLSHTKVAQQIGDTYGAVRKRYSRCMNCLRELIAKLPKE
jgi:RNA polymerase sigma factor (sigma-70 family)